MKISIINGSNLKESMLSETLKKCSDYGYSGNIIDLNKLNLKYCIGCDSCQSKNPGICAFDDGINEVLREYLESDLAVIITSVQFGSFNSITKNFIDRTEPLFLPFQTVCNKKTVMSRRYEHYPNLLIIGILNSENNENAEVFTDIAKNCTLVLTSKTTDIKTSTLEINSATLTEFIKEM